MKKKAVLTVCNHPGTKIDMRGSGDDVTRMYNCLIDACGFSGNDISVVVGPDHSAAAATAENELINLKKELRQNEELVKSLKLECEEIKQTAMRQDEEKGLELASAVNASVIAQSLCVELRIKLEKREKLLQRLKLDKDHEEQLAKRQTEEISQKLAESRKDADIAKNEMIHLKKELKEKGELVKSLKLEREEIKQSAMRQDEQKRLELAGALNASAIAQSLCADLQRKLEKQGNLVQRLKLEKDDEAEQLKRQIEKIDQELAKAPKDADIAKNELINLKRALKEKGELVKSLKLECEEIKQSAMRQDEEKRLELAGALNASAIAQSLCADLQRKLEKQGNLVQRLKLEKDDEAEQLKRQIEKIDQELAKAPKDADIAKNECDKLKRKLERKRKYIKELKLEKDEEVQLAKRQIEEISQKLADTRKDVDIAENKWTKVNEELQEKLQLVQLLQLKCDKTRQSAMRQVEEKELELANILNAAVTTISSSAAAKPCAICLTNEKNMAFGCGHMTCESCGVNEDLSKCPMCRKEITHRIKLFPG